MCCPRILSRRLAFCLRVPFNTYRAGKFKLEIDGGISAYTAPKPAIVMVGAFHPKVAPNRTRHTGKEGARRVAPAAVSNRSSLQWPQSIDAAHDAAQVTSAAVERNAVIGDDAEARKQDVPIVQLNPGGGLPPCTIPHGAPLKCLHPTPLGRGVSCLAATTASRSQSCASRVQDHACIMCYGGSPYEDVFA